MHTVGGIVACDICLICVTVCVRGEGGVKFGQEKCDIFLNGPLDKYMPQCPQTVTRPSTD